jgi:hypothetical protein
MACHLLRSSSIEIIQFKTKPFPASLKESECFGTRFLFFAQSARTCSKFALGKLLLKAALK